MTDDNDTVTGQLFGWNPNIHSQSHLDEHSVIGLTGPAGVGKDTVGMLLSSNYNLYAFAKPLKQALSVLGINEPADRAAKETLLGGKPFSYRKAAQTLGTEWARNLDPDFWLNLAEEKTRHMRRVVFTDVRFDNEAEWVRKQGGVIWHIHGRATTVTGDAAKHASENAVEVKSGDFQLDNSGSISDLTEAVQELLRKKRHG
jgi:hypothetical protein